MRPDRKKHFTTEFRFDDNGMSLLWLVTALFGYAFATTTGSFWSMLGVVWTGLASILLLFIHRRHVAYYR